MRDRTSKRTRGRSRRLVPRRAVRSGGLQRRDAGADQPAADVRQIRRPTADGCPDQGVGPDRLDRGPRDAAGPDRHPHRRADADARSIRPPRLASGRSRCGVSLDSCPGPLRAGLSSSLRIRSRRRTPTRHWSCRETSGCASSASTQTSRSRSRSPLPTVPPRTLSQSWTSRVTWRRMSPAFQAIPKACIPSTPGKAIARRPRRSRSFHLRFPKASPSRIRLASATRSRSGLADSSPARRSPRTSTGWTEVRNSSPISARSTSTIAASPRSS